MLRLSVYRLVLFLLVAFPWLRRVIESFTHNHSSAGVLWLLAGIVVYTANRAIGGHDQIEVAAPFSMLSGLICGPPWFIYAWLITWALFFAVVITLSFWERRATRLEIT